MSLKFKFNRISAIALTGVVTVLGAGVMSLTNYAGTEPAAPVVETAVVMEDNSLTVPGAGMGGVIDDYIGANSGSSVELLSTTALGASLDDTYNEYYDENGSAVGKLIVYTGGKSVNVYNKIKGNERIETGDKKAKVVGHLHENNVATLVKTNGNWYQIISDTVHGFVKKDHFAKGIDAEKLEDKTFVKAVFAKKNNVYMYAEDYEESTVRCVLPKNVQYTLLKKGDTLSQIRVEGVGKGWVYNDDIKIVKVRRYGTTVKYEKESASKIKKGKSKAKKVEEDRAAALEEQQAIEFQQNEENIPDNQAPKATTPVIPEGTYSGGFVIPLNGQFSSGFGWRGGAFHKGVDYWCALNEPIWASADGVVIEAGWSVWGYGNCVVIQHDDHTVTRYAHMNSIACSVGQKVSQYEVIGYAGETGDAYGVHCHFEIIIDGNPVDPLQFF